MPHSSLIYKLITQYVEKISPDLPFDHGSDDDTADLGTMAGLSGTQ